MIAAQRYSRDYYWSI